MARHLVGKPIGDRLYRSFDYYDYGDYGDYGDYDHHPKHGMVKTETVKQVQDIKKLFWPIRMIRIEVIRYVLAVGYSYLSKTFYNL